MTPIGLWDLYGPSSIFTYMAYSITEEEVAEQVEKLRMKQLQQKEKEVKASKFLVRIIINEIILFFFKNNVK